LAFDLLTVGDDTHIGADTVLSGCTVADGVLRVGVVVIGKRCFIGNQCVLRPGTVMGDEVVIEDLTLVRSEVRISAGKRRAGSPAAPLPAAAAPPRFRPSVLRRCVFGLLAGLCFFFFPILIITAVFPGMVLLQLLAAGLGGFWYLAFTPVVALSFVGLLAPEVVLLQGVVHPGRIDFPPEGRAFPVYHRQGLPVFTWAISIRSAVGRCTSI